MTIKEKDALIAWIKTRTQTPFLGNPPEPFSTQLTEAMHVYYQNHKSPAEGYGIRGEPTWNIGTILMAIAEVPIDAGAA